MRQRVVAVVLATALMAGSTAPALANGSAITRDIVLIGTAAGLLISNYARKLHEKRAEEQQVQRRQEAYRDWFYHKYGYYPTYNQFKEWYVHTYGSNPD
jgi:hypothetical protein